MSTLKRSLKSSVLITSVLLALPAMAQQQPAAGQPAPAPGGVAPAPVELQDEKATQPPPAPAAAPAAPGAAAAPATPAAPAAQPAQPAQAAPQAAAPAAKLGTTVDAKTTTAATTLGGANRLTREGGVDVGTGGWTMSYHGYFFAPMRFGIGKRENFQRIPPRIPPQSCTTADCNLNTLDAAASDAGRRAFGEKAYSQTTIHAPLLPDDQYLSWQHTNHNQTDWAEMYFTVGNQIAEGTLDVEGYNFTTASYNNYTANFGIAQGFVTIRPELPWENVRFSAKVGTAWGRYGTAGRWDMGEFTTYLFGRTKVMGGNIRQEIDLGPITLAFEEGYGVKRPDPSTYNTVKFTNLGHVHGYLLYEGLMVGAHFITAWSQDEDHDGQGCDNGNADAAEMCTRTWGGTTPYATVGTTTVSTGARAFGPQSLPVGGEANVWLPDGHLNIAGVEVKYDMHPFGLLYLGWSNISAKNALTVGGAVEVLHADGGGTFGYGVTNNYLDNPRCNPAGGECSSGGNGTVNSVLFQYEFSLMNLIKGLEDGSRFWGEGRDFVAKLYAMYNKVNSKYNVNYDGTWWAMNQYGGVTAPNTDNTGYWQRLGDNYSDHSKLKYGADLYFHALPNVGVGLRADHVRPNNHIPEQAFSVISPRLEFRSTWLTRERIQLQYSRYIYAQRTCAVTTDPALIDSTAIGASSNFANWPADQRCVQSPSAPRIPDGWGGDLMDSSSGKERGQSVSGGNVNQVRPDVNVIMLSASMWW